MPDLFANDSDAIYFCITCNFSFVQGVAGLFGALIFFSYITSLW